MTTKRVSVRPDACVGTGFCSDTAPTVFAVERGRSRVLTPVTESSEDVTDAAEACPAMAILVQDLGTGARIAPPA
jgi:ferredoxin